MTAIIHKTVTVQAGRKIVLETPELPEGTQVKVTLEQIPEKRPAIEHIMSFQGHLEFKTAADVAAYMQEERDSWDR